MPRITRIAPCPIQWRSRYEPVDGNGRSGGADERPERPFPNHLIIAVANRPGTEQIRVIRGIRVQGFVVLVFPPFWFPPFWFPPF